MNFKAIIKPILNNLPFLYDTFGLGTGGTISARYCYSVWLRHLVSAYNNGFNNMPRVVAELGPGDSLGVGLAALLSGAEKYYALDAQKYANPERNIKILDELILLFKNRESIPDDKEFPLVNPKLDSYEFPRHILTEEKLKDLIDDKRIDKIKSGIVNPSVPFRYSPQGKIIIRYCAPWDDAVVVKKDSVDMIIAQAVMEHVNDLEKTYQALYQWLKPGGLFSQDIDFKSHNLAQKWNGHLGYSDWQWKLIKGRRRWVINRASYSDHIKLIQDTGFKIIKDIRTENKEGIKRKSLAKRFKNITDEDLFTSGAFIQARKK